MIVAACTGDPSPDANRSAPEPGAGPRPVAHYTPAKNWMNDPNGLSWTHLSDFGPANAVGGVWEMPDLFPLPVDGDPADMRGVLLVSLNPGAVAGGSGTQYFVGDFDGTRFTAERRR